MSRNKWNKPRPLFSSPVPKSVKEPKMKWKILPIMWLALKRGAMVLGFMMLFSIFVSMVTLIGAASGGAQKGLPDEMVLVLDFENGIYEIPPKASLSDPFVGQVLTIRDYVELIRKAKTDPRVKGVVARMRDTGFALSHADELRQAILSFRESGKFAKVYSSSYGDSTGGLGRYFIASAFDEIWMQPMGVVSIGGVSAQQPFLRGVMDKIGVKPEFYQRKKYKSAYENLTNNEMSEANRESTQALIGDLAGEILSQIAFARSKDEAAMKALVDKGLFTSDEALAEGLIDRADYADVLVAEVNKSITGNPDDKDLAYVYAEDYLPAEKAEQKHAMSLSKKPRVALIYAVGAIMPGNTSSSQASAASPFSVIGGQQVAASNQIAPAIMDAVDDDDIKTIVLRVDSPGGSPVASESILRALAKAKEKGKTVIISMGSVAASGGYWIATNADQIFASPLTITGSIGVVGGKFATAELWKKLGVNWETVEWGKNAGMWSFVDGFSPSEAERMNAMLDFIYANFTKRVAEGRNLSPEEVEKIAQGRVWSGKAALANGLADQAGGLYTALDYAATLNGGQSADDISIEVLPKPKTPLEQFIALFGGEVSAAQSQYGLGKALSGFLAPVASELSRAQSPQDYILYDPISVQ